MECKHGCPKRISHFNDSFHQWKSRKDKRNRNGDCVEHNLKDFLQTCNGFNKYKVLQKCMQFMDFSFWLRLVPLALICLIVNEFYDSVTQTVECYFKHLPKMVPCPIIRQRGYTEWQPAAAASFRLRESVLLFAWTGPPRHIASVPARGTNEYDEAVAHVTVLTRETYSHDSYLTPAHRHICICTFCCLSFDWSMLNISSHVWL